MKTITINRPTEVRGGWDEELKCLCVTDGVELNHYSHERDLPQWLADCPEIVAEIRAHREPEEKETRRGDSGALGKMSVHNEQLRVDWYAGGFEFFSRVYMETWSTPDWSRRLAFLNKHAPKALGKINEEPKP